MTTSVSPRPGNRSRAVLLNGSVGAGKTTVANAVGQQLADAGVPGAVLDLDQLRSCWPAPRDDPFNNRIMCENLATLTATYRRHGMTTLVLAGVVESADERDRYGQVLGVAPTMIRLTADVAELQRRVSARSATVAERDWHVARAPELHDILDQAAIDDQVISTDGRDPRAVAAEIVALLGW